MKKNILLMVSLLTLSSCGLDLSTNPSGSQSEQIDDIVIDDGDNTPSGNLREFSGVSFDNFSVTYDGNPHILREVSGAPEGTTITYTARESHTDVGVYEATALLQKEGYYDKTLRARLTILEAEFSRISFNNLSVEYDGKEHEIKCTGVPSFATVTYTNNKGTEVGTYKATAIINAPNYKELVLTATLTITQPLKEFEGITFEDATYYYDGKSHTIYPQNVPLAASVKYIGTSSYKEVNKNGYTITVEISQNGYKTLRLSAKLYIILPEITGVSFLSRTAWFDAQPQKFEVQNLPYGAEVTYKCLNNTKLTNIFTDIGEYNCQATITMTNYETKVLTAKITIKDPYFVGVDSSKTAFEFDENIKYRELYNALSQNNVTIRSKFESVRTTEATGEERLRFLFSETVTAVADNQYTQYTRSYDTNTNELEDIWFETGTILGDYTIFTDSFTGGELEKFPKEGFKGTLLQDVYRVFQLHDEGEDGSFVSHPVKGYVSDIPELHIEENRITLIVHNYYFHNADKWIDEPYINDERVTYEFINIGNTTVTIPEELSGKLSDIDTYEDYYKIIIDGITYYLEDDHAVADLGVYYMNLATNDFAHTFTVLPQIINYPVLEFKTPASRYTQFDTREGFTHKLYVGEYDEELDGYPYQGEYASLGYAYDESRWRSGIYDFVCNEGTVKYYGEW